MAPQIAGFALGGSAGAVNPLVRTSTPNPDPKVLVPALGFMGAASVAMACACPGAVLGMPAGLVAASLALGGSAGAVHPLVRRSRTWQASEPLVAHSPRSHKPNFRRSFDDARAG